MKQLSFFAQKNKSDLVDCNDPKIWKLYTDGASRNNPGPSGIGFCLKNGDRK